MISESFNVNEQGHLTCGSADCVTLAQTYGTPLYVFDETMIRKTFAEYRDALKHFFGGNGKILYASKAFSCKEIYRIAASEGIGADVVSAGEIYTAVSAGFAPSELFFHGNNKTPGELEYAVSTGVGRIVVDNMTELDRLDGIAEKANKKVKILLRIKPGIEAHTHSFIRTGQIDSKFGFSLENGEALSAAKRAMGYKNVELTGFHCHIGSQIFSEKPFRAAAAVMIDFMADLRGEVGAEFHELNLGGGFGIKYLESDAPLPIASFMQAVAEALEQQAVQRDYPMPKVFFEPGRSIVAPAGLTLYKVGAVKNIENVRTYVAVDGGMGDNPRYALYGAAYDIEIANRASLQKNFIATVAGKCCESGDIIQEHAPMQTPEVGDVLAVLCTGAYNYSMASNYNRIPRPAAVMVKNGESREIIRRETLEDIVRNDL